MSIQIDKKFKNLVSNKTFNNALVLAKYLYVEENNPPIILVENNDIIFRYQNKQNILNIYVNDNKYKIISEYSPNQIYEIVNYTKLFYHAKTDELCLFTGAFNPPTIAHYHMIDSAMQAHNFDYIIFAVSNQDFLDRKQRKTGGWSYNESQRLQMILEMTYKNKNVLIWGAERGWTYDVLCAVKERYLPKELYFALGSDKLQQIGKWKNHDKLLEQFCFYIQQRGDNIEYINDMCLKLFKKTKFILTKDDEMYKQISATCVRDKIDKGLDYKHLVCPEVYELLTKYKKEEDIHES